MDLPPPSGTPASGRLRLDRLPRELVEQAGDLLAAQQRLPALLDAVISISSDLSLDATLRRIVEAARLLVEARYGALGVIAEDGEQLSDFITVGIDPDVVSTIGDSPRGKGILGLIISDPHPLRLPDLTEHPKAYGFPPGHPAMRSFLGVPISVRGRVFGNLYLTEKSAGAPFTPEDEGIVLALAGAAGVAIDNARLYEEAQRAQRDRGRLAVYEDRDRIARDLHDLVIQRLFATGLSLQGLGRFLQDSGAEARLESAVSDLDETIREIRRTIFSLQENDPKISLRARALEEVSQSASTLGFEPHVRLEGSLDDAVPVPVQAHVLAALRESLSNIARHATASEVDVVMQVADGSLTLNVSDDGVGLGRSRRRSGLANMRERAETLSGSMTTSRGLLERGTTITWRVPLHPEP